MIEDLEYLIDRDGLRPVLAAIAEICYLKAAHIAEHWQDTATAKQWTATGKALDKVMIHHTV